MNSPQTENTEAFSNHRHWFWFKTSNDLRLGLRGPWIMTLTVVAVTLASGFWHSCLKSSLVLWRVLVSYPRHIRWTWKFSSKQNPTEDREVIVDRRKVSTHRLLFCCRFLCVLVRETFLSAFVNIPKVSAVQVSQTRWHKWTKGFHNNARWNFQTIEFVWKQIYVEECPPVYGSPFHRLRWGKMLVHAELGNVPPAFRNLLPLWNVGQNPPFGRAKHNK